MRIFLAEKDVDVAREAIDLRSGEQLAMPERLVHLGRWHAAASARPSASA